jgi:hypothetical protein
MEHVGQRLPLMSLFIFLVHHFSLIIYLVSFIYRPNWWRCFSRNNMFISFITFYPCPTFQIYEYLILHSVTIPFLCTMHACMFLLFCYAINYACDYNRFFVIVPGNISRRCNGSGEWGKTDISFCVKLQPASSVWLAYI